VSRTGSLVSNAEWCFKVDKAVDDVEHTVDFTIQTRAGVNPGTSDDVRVSFLSEGKYVSSKQANTVLQGIYNDASTQTLAQYISTRQPYIQFQVT